MNKLEVINREEFGIEKETATSVEGAFLPKVKEGEVLANQYAELIKKDITKEVSEEARFLRLKAVKVKAGIASIHKTQKEFALSFGKFCDAIKRKETEPIQQMIDGALEIEKFAEIQEKKRLDELQEKRVSLISEYIEKFEIIDYSLMNEDVWLPYLESKKNQFKEKIEAAKKIETEKIKKEKAEREEREKIEKENIKLKKEAEEREAKEKAEAEKRAKIEAERLEKIEAERKEVERKERIQKEKHEAELKAEREAHEEAERKEKAKREKLEEELKSKKEAEEKAKREEREAIQNELKKGDKEKVSDLILDMESLKTKYEFKSESNNKMYQDVSDLIDKVISFINKKQ